MIKALIFDLDGTLADTEMLHYEAWRKALTANGVEEFSFSAFLQYVGTSNEKVAGDYISSGSIKIDQADLIGQKQSIYRDLIPKVELCTGVRQFLTKYHDKKLLAVASSSYEKEIHLLLESHGLVDYFNLVLGGDMVKNRKPDPEIYLTAQQRLGVLPQECIAFEDTMYGLTAAKRAGMYGIAIPNRFTEEHDFYGADKIVESFNEVDDRLIEKMVTQAPK